jgi:2-polyprenyl-6-hydroxyphenyl methylase/3-demethylubiquinone-9 3-methyltransferase
MTTHASEVQAGQRFEFGKNWQKFIDTLTDERIREAEESLVRWLGEGSLKDRTFLDIGSGSGLFSLAARRLGAKVYSLDYDPASVACTRYLRDRFFAGDSQWTVVEGSAIDAEFMKDVPVADIVYSWGVLHHTSAMWQGLELAASKVAAGGKFFVALYNDQGWRSKGWLAVKRFYNVNLMTRLLTIGVVGFGYMWGKKVLRDVLTFRNPLGYWKNYKSNRGMSAWYDLLDWLGGYPFEVASGDAMFYWGKQRGLRLDEVLLRSAHGCNEFVFVKS